MDHEPDNLRKALQRLPVPEPRPGFVDRALSRASAAAPAAQRPMRYLTSGWQAWIGAALGAAVTAILMLTVLRPDVAPAPSTSITLAVNEARNFDVLIDSERDLQDATIRIALTGGIAVDGYGDERNIRWHTRLDKGRNVLSLPVVAQTAGAGRLVAVVEHGGRTRRVTIDLTIVGPPQARS